MATTATQSRRRNGGNFETQAEEAASFGLDAARDAQETFVRSLRAGVETAATFADVGQRVGRELIALSVAGAKQALRLSAEIQASTLDVLQAGIRPWTDGQPVLRTWQRLLDGTTQAFSRFAETMQGTTEEGTERIKQAVEVMAEQVKESTAQLGQLGEEVMANRASRTASGKV